MVAAVTTHARPKQVTLSSSNPNTGVRGTFVVQMQTTLSQRSHCRVAYRDRQRSQADQEAPLVKHWASRSLTGFVETLPLNTSNSNHGVRAFMAMMLTTLSRRLPWAYADHRTRGQADKAAPLVNLWSSRTRTGFDGDADDAAVQPCMQGDGVQTRGRRWQRWIKFEERARRCEDQMPSYAWHLKEERRCKGSLL